MLYAHTSDESCYVLLDCARNHGENSEPDHEVGDLADFLVSCWRVMNPEQRLKALSTPEAQLVLEGYDYESLFE
jgi:hypothetical protein